MTDIDGSMFYAFFYWAAGLVLLFLVIPGALWLATRYGSLTMPQWLLYLVKAVTFVGGLFVCSLVLLALAIWRGV